MLAKLSAIFALSLLSTVALADGVPPRPVPIPATGPQLLDHNGSLMELIALPNSAIEIRYVRPRPGLWEVGVRPGMVLVRGVWTGPLLTAQAFVFSPGCAMPYPVNGGIIGDVLRLQGMAPLVDPFICAAVGFAYTGNSTLYFVPLKP